MNDIAERRQSELAIAHANRIWLGPAGPGPQTRLFRKAVQTGAMPRSVRLELFAEAVYNLWVNGRHVQRGPTLHHAHRRPVAILDLLDVWRPGVNVLAAAVHARNAGTHNHVPSGDPGLTATLVIEQADGQVVRHVTDASWRTTDRTGWTDDGPRRNWALGVMEVFDATAAPTGWQEIEFDDDDWSAAEVCRPTSSIEDSTWIHDPSPLLRETWVPMAHATGLCEAAPKTCRPTAADGTGKYVELLSTQSWQPAQTAKMHGIPNARGGGFAIEDLNTETDTMLWVDLGATCVGQVVLECDCPTTGAIDVAWGETLKDGLPEFVRKGTPYADHIIAAPGRLRWEPMGFNSARYIAVIFRGMKGKVDIHRFGMRTTEPDLNWVGHFECDDEQLNGIWRICERTIRVGTQESLMDCASREQAAYIGDGHPVARWIAQLTGDVGHWRYLVEESFARPARHGLVRTTVFTSLKRSLIDYTLLGIIGARDYARISGDSKGAAKAIATGHKILAWYRSRMNDAGLIDVSGDVDPNQPSEREDRFDPAGWDKPWSQILFIDHAGIGWHNKEEPGIDRRGVNAAVNALYVLALRAMAELEQQSGDDAKAADLLAEADRLAQTAGKAFYAESQHAFADGLLDGALLEQISQQTNTWCLEAGLCPPQREREVLDRILRRDDEALARSGPYFWYYMFPLLARHGMHAEALDEIRRLWAPMCDAGATTVWETFAGDWLDTWCHPWSAAPAGFLIDEILGLNPLRLAGEKPILRPRTDLLGKARGRAALPAGMAEIQWHHGENGGVTLSGTLPQGVTAELQSPGGEKLAEISSQWTWSG